MSFRPIQPASQQGSSTPSGEPPGDLEVIPRKRSHITRQACDNCRKTKSKCDGERPACFTCVARDQQCSYDPRPQGETVFVKTRARLKALESLVTSLMQKSDHEAFNVLRQIRTYKNIDLLLESGVVDLSSPVADLLTKPSQSPMSPSPLPFNLPAIDIIEKGYDAFYSCSSKIFHVFSRQEMDRYLHTMTTGGEEHKLAACCTAIVAAIGHQFANPSMEEHIERTLYAITRTNLEDIMDASPLDAIRLCALLAMYHTMDKSTAGLAYIDIGLRLARQHGLYNVSQNPVIPDEKWPAYRRTWRTLLFQASWLACTLGYISCIDVITLRVPVESIPVDASTELGDVVQTEMAKIVFLSTDMLRACLSFEDPSLRAIEPITKQLHDWYVMLPKDMHLSTLELDGLPEDTRRSIYQIHLLYLNALMLLYRRVSAKCSKMLRLERKRDNGWILPESFRRILQDGTIAAKHSSRILSLLLDEDQLFKRCWMMINQAYTSAIILLYSIAQKQLHEYAPSEWAEDLAQAGRCLTILDFCGSSDPIARKLHTVLVPHYKVLSDHVLVERPSPEELDANDLPSESELFQSLKVTDHFTSHLHSLPEAGSPQQIAASLSLLIMVCRPFDDPEDETNDKDGRGLASFDDEDKYEYVQLMEKLDWDFGYGVPFQWGLDEQACKIVYARLLGQNRSGIFLGSAQPSGWRS